MTEIIFSDFGVEITKHDGRFFIRYDAGELADQFREDEILEDEVPKVKSGEQGAYAVLLASQQRSLN